MVARFTTWSIAVDFVGAVQLTVSALLQSPQFLYRAEPQAPGAIPGAIEPVAPYALASRLSFFLWEGQPDAELLAAAAAGTLSSPNELRAQATRMLADGRARRVFWNFHRQWLNLDRILLSEHEVRTPEVDALWSSGTAASAHRETQRFIENVLMETGSLRAMLTSSRAWLDPEMARVYGVPFVGDAAEVTLDPAQRAGLITRASFLAGDSHRGATSPPIRGNSILSGLLCRLPTPPPANIDTTPPTQKPNSGPQTNRAPLRRAHLAGSLSGLPPDAQWDWLWL